MYTRSRTRPGRTPVNDKRLCTCANTAERRKGCVGAKTTREKVKENTVKKKDDQTQTTNFSARRRLQRAERGRVPRGLRAVVDQGALRHAPRPLVLRRDRQDPVGRAAHQGPHNDVRLVRRDAPPSPRHVLKKQSHAFNKGRHVAVIKAGESSTAHFFATRHRDLRLKDVYRATVASSPYVGARVQSQG